MAKSVGYFSLISNFISTAKVREFNGLPVDKTKETDGLKDDRCFELLQFASELDAALTSQIRDSEWAAGKFKEYAQALRSGRTSGASAPFSYDTLRLMAKRESEIELLQRVVASLGTRLFGDDKWKEIAELVLKAKQAASQPKP